jgi:DNA-binding NarL/FixJ family response regulator
VDPQDTRRAVLVLNGAGIVTALCELFEQFWTTSVPVDADPEREDDALTAQEQAVLRLLAQGCTDEVVARRLGISVRTGRRITAGVANQLDAKSRFQLGVKAILRGWVSPDAVN